MPAFTATTTPQLLFHSLYGSSPKTNQVAIQVANGATGTVYVAKSQAKCVIADTNYITENTSSFSVELRAGEEVWVVASSGTVALVYGDFGPGA